MSASGDLTPFALALVMTWSAVRDRSAVRISRTTDQTGLATMWDRLRGDVGGAGFVHLAPTAGPGQPTPSAEPPGSRRAGPVVRRLRVEQEGQGAWRRARGVDGGVGCGRRGTARPALPRTSVRRPSGCPVPPGEPLGPPSR